MILKLIFHCIFSLYVCLRLYYVTDYSKTLFPPCRIIFLYSKTLFPPFYTIFLLYNISLPDSYGTRFPHKLIIVRLMMSSIIYCRPSAVVCFCNILSYIMCLLFFTFYLFPSSEVYCRRFRGSGSFVLYRRLLLNEPGREKTGFLQMRKQRRRSASR